MEIALSKVEFQPISIKNKDDIIKYLEENLVKYNKVLTEDTVLEGKSDLATLRKLLKDIEDSRKNVKKQCLAPYEKIEEDFKEITDKINSTILNLDTQVKSFENKEKEEKLQEIVEYFDNKIGEFNKLIDFDKIFQEQWLNKTFTIKKVQMEIDHIIAKTKMDMNSLENSFSNDEAILKQAKMYYYENIKEPTVLSLTMQRISKIKEFSKNEQESKEKQQRDLEIERNQENIEQNTEKSEQTNKKVGRVFKVVCTYEKLVELNDFMVAKGGYETNVIERFEV